MTDYKQLIFIDDSGDPGFKLNRGASKFFIIACVVFDSKIGAEYTSASLKMLKEKMGWKQEREFKFHRANDMQKEMFFAAIKNHDFKIRAIVVDKSKIAEPNLKKSESFYSLIIQTVLHEYKGMNKARIALDGSGNRNFRKKATVAVRKAVNKNGRKMVDFRLVDSKDEVLIQLADMIAGAIGAKYDSTKRMKRDYLKMIRSKVEDIKLY